MRWFKQWRAKRAAMRNPEFWRLVHASDAHIEAAEREDRTHQRLRNGWGNDQSVV